MLKTLLKFSINEQIVSRHLPAKFQDYYYCPEYIDYKKKRLLRFFL